MIKIKLKKLQEKIIENKKLILIITGVVILFLILRFLDVFNFTYLLLDSCDVNENCINVKCYTISGGMLAINKNYKLIWELLNGPVTIPDENSCLNTPKCSNDKVCISPSFSIPPSSVSIENISQGNINE